MTIMHNPMILALCTNSLHSLVIYSAISSTALYYVAIAAPKCTKCAERLHGAELWLNAAQYT